MSNPTGPQPAQRERAPMVQKAKVASEARALTQREEPLLSTVAARLTERSLQIAAVDGSRDLLEVSSGDPGPTLQAPDSAARLFGDNVVGIDQGPEAAAWLSDVLGRRCRLLRRFAGCKRTAAGSHWADIAPLLVVSKASLQALAEATGKEIPADRFRPNVILEGPMEPHAEDTWDEMCIGPLRLQRLGPCARCAIIDVAQGQGKRDNAVYGPLVQHRGQAVFGQYYRPILAAGAPPSDRTLEVGTEENMVEVLQLDDFIPRPGTPLWRLGSATNAALHVPRAVGGSVADPGGEDADAGDEMMCGRMLTFTRFGRLTAWGARLSMLAPHPETEGCSAEAYLRLAREAAYHHLTKLGGRGGQTNPRHQERLMLTWDGAVSHGMEGERERFGDKGFPVSSLKKKYAQAAEACVCPGTVAGT
ncbi:MOCOS [Symbiodinium sp. CCMP2456]|nr:MOCOS [Symbiodinium sp. CCMP2456]